MKYHKYLAAKHIILYKTLMCVRPIISNQFTTQHTVCPYMVLCYPTRDATIHNMQPFGMALNIQEHFLNVFIYVFIYYRFEQAIIMSLHVFFF